MRTANDTVRQIPLLVGAALLLAAAPAAADILGEENLSNNPEFNLTARPGTISTWRSGREPLWYEYVPGVRATKVYFTSVLVSTVSWPSAS